MKDELKKLERVLKEREALEQARLDHATGKEVSFRKGFIDVLSLLGNIEK